LQQVCQRHAARRWSSSCTRGSSTNKTELLLKLALSTIDIEKILDIEKICTCTELHCTVSVGKNFQTFKNFFISVIIKFLSTVIYKELHILCTVYFFKILCNKIILEEPTVSNLVFSQKKIPLEIVHNHVTQTVKHIGSVGLACGRY
jgi:hypothetical protein